MPACRASLTLHSTCSEHATPLVQPVRRTQPALSVLSSLPLPHPPSSLTRPPPAPAPAPRRLPSLPAACTLRWACSAWGG